MVGQILPNNNEMCYSNFSPKFSQLNTALDPQFGAQNLHSAHCSNSFVFGKNYPNFD
jgi:hypothetical protein